MNYKRLSSNRCKTKPKLVSGFTLVEALVSITIVSIIMATVLFNYSTFSDNLSLSSAAQELAVTIRQAQTYGLSVKEVGLGGGVFDRAYGVYFNKDDSTNYYLFADIVGNKKYDSSSGELVTKFTLRNGVTINAICNVVAGVTNCPPGAGAVMMDVTFLRPNPDAKIYFTNSLGVFVGNQPPANGYLTGKVILRSPKGKTLTVTIESTGQVLVGDIIQS